MDALVDGGVMKRIDLAINDHTGILDIPELAEKCRKREYIGKSRSYKFYQSGELIKHREDDREYMGRTLYLGSLKSDVYFCIYEKDYEQYVKLGTPLEEADIINRFEIRLRNERAYYAVRDLLTYYDAEQTAFSIINQYVRFVDEEPDKRKNDWKLNDRWAWFIGDNRQSLKLTTKPEPYNLGAGILRAVGNSLMPLVFLIVSSVLNIGLDLWFITGLGMGVRGAAVATVLAQGVSVILCVLYILKSVRILIPSKHHFQPDKKLYLEMLEQGGSMGLMNCLVCAGTAILQTGINDLGYLVIAGHTSARKLFSFFLMPLTAMVASVNSVFFHNNSSRFSYSFVRTLSLHPFCHAASFHRKLLPQRLLPR